ncbi:MAG: glycosyltransferase [Hyphomicrobium sp.]|uniref:glycosyltransferase n=1 Tax=Hyphomicrobium sp. TaxID=82 RepID=UPI0039E47C32
MASGLRGYAVAQQLRDFGWRSIVIPKQLELGQRQRLMKLEQPDVIVLQKSHHPLNRPRFYPGAKCVFDIDDADFIDPAQREGVIECMRESACVIAGSRHVAEYARQYNPAVDIVWTGSRPRSGVPMQKPDRPVVAWAISSASDYPEEHALIQSALDRVKSKDWEFWLFGVKDGDSNLSLVSSLADRGIQTRTFGFLSYEKYLDTLEQVSIGLAPLMPAQSQFSAGKSFGKVLGYLNCCVATIASNCAEHPMFFRHGKNGFLASSPDEFAECIDLLLSDATLRERITQQAHQDYIDKLSLDAVARRTDEILRKVLKGDALRPNEFAG